MIKQWLLFVYQLYFYWLSSLYVTSQGCLFACLGAFGHSVAQFDSSEAVKILDLDCISKIGYKCLTGIKIKHKDL